MNMLSGGLKYALYMSLTMALISFANAASMVEERMMQWKRNQVEWTKVVAQKRNFLAIGDLRSLNEFWNSIPFESDLSHWGVPDYWATPTELLRSNGGDAEDFALAKYFSLRKAGIPAKQLKMVYVRSRLISKPHMVMAYYESLGADPLILDSATNKISRGSERKDLEVVYSFDDEDLHAATQTRLFGNVIERMEHEFM